ncbi:MFS transporter [Arsenicicoccus sp. oral taxon 190]|uniref:MFS transporter n=1 Tax=Arsenicicoccus sp. oral taxon 190 TaxID=1658671 RepID=UPI00155DABA5|nr:MFS transporter [Arsenicicoccus sp. oral taxon 190]
MDPSLRLLRSHPSFRWYWVGQSISSAGSQVTALALPLVTALALHGSPRDVGFVATAAMAPYLLFSLLAGHYLEARPKRAVMIPADLAQALLLGAIPVAWWAGSLSVPLLAGIAFLCGTAALCFGVVGFSYVPDLVATDDLPAANRAIQGSRTVTEVAGPGLAGLLVGALGAPVAILVDAVSYLASAVGVAAAHPRHRPGPDESTPGSTPESTPEVAPQATPDAGTDDHPRPSVLAGLRVLFTNPHLRALTIHAALYNLASEIFTLNLVLWAVQEQHLPTATYGLAMGAGGIGGLIGTLTALRLSERLGLGRAFIASLALSCGIPVLAVLVPAHGLALGAILAAVMLVSGIGLGNANVYSLTLRQAAIPRDQLTRSAGAYTQVMYGSIPLGGALAGVLGESLGTRRATAAGAVLLACSILPMLTRHIRTLTSATHPAATHPAA